MRFALLMVALVAGCSSPPPVPADPTVEAGARRDIDVAAFATELEAGKVVALVDVRTPEEYAAGHVPGAVNIPVDVLGERLGELPAEGELHLICQSGGRSARAADALVGAGRSAVNIKGGTAAWIAAGKPTE